MLLNLLLVQDNLKSFLFIKFYKSSFHYMYMLYSVYYKCIYGNITIVNIISIVHQTKQAFQKNTTSRNEVLL